MRRSSKLLSLSGVKWRGFHSVINQLKRALRKATTQEAKQRAKTQLNRHNDYREGSKRRTSSRMVRK